MKKFCRNIVENILFLAGISQRNEYRKLREKEAEIEREKASIRVGKYRL